MLPAIGVRRGRLSSGGEIVIKKLMAGVLAAMCVVLLIAASGASAAEGPVAPELVSFSLSSSEVNVTTSSQTLKISGHAIDGGYGFIDAEISLRAPGESDPRTVYAVIERVEGVHSVYFQGRLTIPQYVESGEWKIGYVRLRDASGAYSEPSWPQLKEAGMSYAVQVKSTPDTTAPELTSLSISPTEVDVTEAAAEVTVTAQVDDDVSGIAGVTMSLHAPDGASSQAVYAVLELIGGNTREGTLQAVFTIPRYVESGEWKVGYIHLHDVANNYRALSWGQLKEAGLPYSIQVESRPDVEPPELTSISIEPGEINDDESDREVLVTADVRDDLSGVAGGDLSLCPPDASRSQIAYGTFERVGGTSREGVFQAVVTIPRFVEAGEWKFGYIHLDDAVGNSRTLSSGQLGEAGLPYSVEVERSEEELDIGERPQVVSLAIEPTEIDLSSSEVPVTIRARVTDTEGLRYVQAVFNDPSDSGGFGSNELLRVSGTETDGVYEGVGVFCLGYAPGAYKVSMSFVNTAGYEFMVYPEELAEDGLTHQVVVLPPIPTLKGISPASGPGKGGSRVHISGSGFRQVSSVHFGDESAEFIEESEEGITAFAPPGSGTVDVTVTTPGGTTLKVPADRFTYEGAGEPPAEEKEPPRLKELGFEPAEFDASGGEVPVHVTARVEDSSGVVYGNIVLRSPSGERFVKATGFEHVAGSEDLFETVATFPEGSEPGEWLVSNLYFVDHAGNELSLEAEGLVERGLPYEVTVLQSKVEPPEVSAISPSSGPEAGGTKVVISGSGLKGAEAVRFGGTKAEFEIRSAEEIVAYSPPGKGNVGVVVETAGGVSDERNFAYVPAATVSLTSSPNPSVRGQKVTFTATVSPSEGGATPVGTVAFVEGTSTLGVANLSKGVAKLSTTTLGAGEHPVVAVYSGDSHYGEARSSTLTQVVSKASAEVTLTSSLNPAPFGSSGTLKAHVAAVAPGAGTPAGTVTFREGETELDTVQLSGGYASLSLKALEPGTHKITATYSGDANDKASEAGPFTQTVTKAATELALTSTLNPAPFGSSATLKATVKAVAPGAGSPAGTVTFREGETVLAIVPLSAGSAKYALKSAAPGEYAITATYNGEADYEGSSGSIVQAIVAAGTELALTSTKNPAPHGSTGTLRATVKAVAPGAGTPTGTVTFREGETVLAIVPLSAGAATYPLKSLAIGEHKITATYNGNSDYEAGEGSIAQVITG
jgi:hypothetical protein